MNQVLIQDETLGGWRLFEQPEEVVVAYQASDVVPASHYLAERVDASQLYAAGFLSYEAAAAFDEAFVVRPSEEFPLLWFGLYANYQRATLPLPKRLAPQIYLINSVRRWRKAIFSDKVISEHHSEDIKMDNNKSMLAELVRQAN